MCAAVDCGEEVGLRLSIVGCGFAVGCGLLVFVWAGGGASGAQRWAFAVRLGLAPYLPWVAHGQTGCWGLYHYVGSGGGMLYGGNEKNQL